MSASTDQPNVNPDEHSLDQEATAESLSETELELDATSESGLAAELEEAQAKVSQYYDQLLRAKAEVENIRRRAEEDVAKARKFGAEKFAESLLPVRDSLEAALAQEEQSIEILREGVETTLRQVDNAFARNALQEIAPQAGDKFDPHTHQAMSAIPCDQPEGCVAQTLQKGYMLSDRVLRPALVMVSSGPAA